MNSENELLQQLTACCWPATSLDRESYSAVVGLASAHDDGVLRLTSCQRVEIYRAGDCTCDAPTRLHGRAALRRLAEIAGGLEAAVLGEEQVMGQVRAAVSAAPPPLKMLGAHAIAAARALRREFGLAADPSELFDRAIDHAGNVRGPLLVLGTGHMARRVTERARRGGLELLAVAGRTRPRWLPATIRFAPLAELQALPACRTAVGCLGASALPIDPATLPGPDLLIDLGTPLNFLPAPGIRLVTIADLFRQDEADRERRLELRARLAEILDRRLDGLKFDGRSTVGSLRLEVERMRLTEVARARQLHPEIPPQAIEAITRSLVNRIFHRPSERLKRLADPALESQLAALFACPSHTSAPDES